MPACLQHGEVIGAVAHGDRVARAKSQPQRQMRCSASQLCLLAEDGYPTSPVSSSIFHDQFIGLVLVEAEQVRRRAR